MAAIRSRSRGAPVLTGVACMAAVAYVALLALPLLDTRFNVLSAHPEDYAAGSLGLAVNASYVAVAVALLTLAISMLPVRGWAIAVPLLLVPAGLLSAALALDPIGVARANPLVLAPIVGLALAPTVAVLTLRDRFASWTPAVAGVGIAALLAFIALVLSPDGVSGLVNRVFDALIGAWIAIASLALRRRAFP